jgi:hypothetical protein
MALNRRQRRIVQTGNNKPYPVRLAFTTHGIQPSEKTVGKVLNQVALGRTVQMAGLKFQPTHGGTKFRVYDCRQSLAVAV